MHEAVEFVVPSTLRTRIPSSFHFLSLINRSSIDIRESGENDEAFRVQQTSTDLFYSFDIMQGISSIDECFK